MQVSHETQKIAGRLRHFVSAWISITADQNILNIIKHCSLEIGNPTQSRLRPEIHFDPTERERITSEIARLLELGVIEPAVHNPDEYISTIFVRKKKSGQYRILRNTISKWIPFGRLCDSRLEISPISYRFYWQGRLYQYTCIPNGLSPAPRRFNKVLTPVYSTLRQKGHLNVGYIDDSYLQGKDTNECLLNISDTQTLFTRLGFVINAEIIRHSRPANYIFSLCPCCVNDN